MALKSGAKNCLQACSTIHMHYFRRAIGFQLQQEHSSHQLAVDNDEFAELGSPLASGLRRPVKLMTEKTDRIKKNNAPRWNSSGTCSTVEARAECAEMDSKGILLSDIVDNALDETDATNASKDFITVAKIPPSIELPKVVEALSSFGKISNSSVRTLRDGNACCYVKFKREKANQKALSAGVITVNDICLRIQPGHGMVTVRVANVCSKTSDSVVHEIFRSCGFLIKVVRIDENTLDAFFGLAKKSDSIMILKRLNYTIMDDCNWSATLESNDTAPTAPTASPRGDEEIDDASFNSGSKIGKQIEDLKQLYTMKMMHIKDLENLHEAIMHIESRNAALRGQN